MRCLSQRLECQGGHVGSVPSYFGRTRRVCCSLGRTTLTCRSSFYEEVPSTRQVEVPEEVGVVLLLQCERDGTTEIKSHLQSAWRVPVCRGVDRRTSTSRLLFGKEWRCSRREEVLAEAQHRRGPSSTAAQPIPEGRDVAPPCLGVSQDLGSRGHQTVSHGPLAAWRSHGEGHDCGPPVCRALQHGVDCLLLRLFARCMLAPKHTRHAPFRPSRFLWDCYGCRAGWCLAAHTVPRCISNHVITVDRGVAHAEVEASQSASRRTTACFRRGSMPVCRGRPSSVPAVWDGGWWSDSMQRVDVKWETRSTRCAITSGNETLRPLIRVACAGSSDSSHSMPDEVVARSSPAVVDGERPSRSSWCEFASPAIGAAGPGRRMVLAK
ncbi:hypothetical protein TcYC6_0006980 [Trypanosoma cruzi]|nr:hypothetical protein TcYC6_0006980 [Trypanosoma cruzi]